MTDAHQHEAIEFRIANLERAMLYLLEARQRGLPWSLYDARIDARMECQTFIDWIRVQR